MNEKYGLRRARDDASSPAPELTGERSNKDYQSGVVETAQRLEPDAEEKAPRRLPLITVEALLREQQSLTAVDRFSAEHDGKLGNAKFYRELLPLERPRPGQQYAFEVDLDACTGCKACVAACHTLNGLDEGETFRSVGLLTGGSASAPKLQTLTSSCHHCVEPACLTGCPVGAYEKDPLTGIVRHLDDQCFGCQYCTLMCPYDAPKYHEAKGIVRKCDMCSSRLAEGEAPACVEACPGEAIAIRIVERGTVEASADARHFVPGTVDRDGTVPTTAYKSARSLPDNMLPVDYYRVSVSAAHRPLVFMLVLSQLSVGTALVTEYGRYWLGTTGGRSTVALGFSFGALAIALLASLFHLGRPWLMFRGVLAVRTSWLSREVLAFGLSFKLSLASLAIATLPGLSRLLENSSLAWLGSALSTLTPLLGLLSVFCSVMVYAATRREHWSFGQTSFRFFGSALLLGCASVLLLQSFTGNTALRASALQPGLEHGVIGVAVAKLAFEFVLLRSAASRRYSGAKRMALVMLGELKVATLLRITLLALFGVGVPVATLVSGFTSPLLAATSWFALLVSELSERYLFFAAAPSPRMPGSLR